MKTTLESIRDYVKHLSPLYEVHGHADHITLENTYTQMLINPSLATAYALQMYTSAQTEDAQRWAGLALCQAVTWMGHNTRARRIFEEVVAPSSYEEGTVLYAYKRWVWFTIAKRKEEDLTANYLDPSLHIFQENNLLDTYHRCLFEAVQDDILMGTTNYPNAADHFEQLREYFEQGGLYHDYALTFLVELYQLISAHRYEEANQHLSILRDYSEGSEYLRFYLLLEEGRHLMNLMAYDEAKSHYTAAYSIAQGNKWGFPLVYACYELAVLLNETDYPSEALIYAQRGGQTAEEIQNIPLQLESHQLRGQAFLQMGELFQAESHLDYILNAGGDAALSQVSTAFALAAKGELALMQGQLSLALQHLHRVYEQHHLRENDFRLHLKCVMLLGLTYHRAGNEEEAQKYLDQAYAAAWQKDLSQRYTTVALRFARVSAEMNNPEAGHELLTRLQTDSDVFSTVPHLNNIITLTQTEVLIAQLREEKASPERDASLQQAQETLLHLAEEFARTENHHYAVEAHLSAADAALQRDDTHTAASLLRRIQPSNHFATAYAEWLFARLAERQQRTDDALRHYHEAVTTHSHAQSSLPSERDAGRYASANDKPFEDALTYALDQMDYGWALRYVESATSQSLRAGMGIPLDWETLSPLVERLTQQLSTRYGDAWTVLRYVTIGGELNIRFTLTPDALAFDLVTPPSGLIEILGAEENHEFRHRAFLNAYSTGDTASLFADLSEAEKTLLPESLTRRLPDPDHHLIIVRNGQWGVLPFQAFMGSDGTPLLARATLSFAPSLLALSTLLDRPSHPNPRGLMCGQTLFEGHRNLHTPAMEYDFFRYEYDHIPFECFLNREVDVDALVGKAFDGELNLYSHFHFSTHVYEHRSQWQKSALVFNGQHIPITAIRRWQLEADLVALPDCVTGSGAWYPGDETVGLAQAFLMAGARSVLAAQWHTLDAPIACFTAGFYTGLAAGKSPAQALAYAQRELYRRDEQAPYKWAPYYITGVA
jgi:hypothetical protein